MSEVQIGYGGSAVQFVGTASQLRAALHQIEAADIDHIGIGDHVSFYVGFGYDGLQRATAILAASQRLRVVIGVYLLPLRHPVTVARQLADIAALAPGRLTLGVGIGGEDPKEVANCGVDPRTRGRRTDESLAIVRRLLAGEVVDFDGDFYRLDQASIAPAPAEPIPILVGGRSDAGIRRAAMLGDGWLGIWVSARRYGEVIDTMSTIAAESGRGEVRWRNALNLWCGVGPTKKAARGPVAEAMQNFYQLPYERFEKWSPHGTVDDLAEFVAPYVDAGCHEFNLLICGPDLDTEIDAVGRIKQLVAG
jgi:alkanesulfonate monooxygenase SsuD/methylene tetrahydromethanopterin reductase-like flavin-dependent oxidoreductase (luciferase family)